MCEKNNNCCYFCSRSPPLYSTHTTVLSSILTHLSRMFLPQSHLDSHRCTHLSHQYMLLHSGRVNLRIHLYLGKWKLSENTAVYFLEVLILITWHGIKSIVKRYQLHPNWTKRVFIHLFQICISRVTCSLTVIRYKI